MFGVRVVTSSTEEANTLFTLEQLPSDTNISLEDVLFKHLHNINRSHLVSPGSGQEYKLDIKIGMSPDCTSAKVQPAAVLGEILAFGNYITFTVSKIERAAPNNVLAAMMARSQQLQLPGKKVSKTRKDCVYNQILDLLKAQDLGWPGIGDVGARFVAALTDLIWKIDPHIKKRHVKIPKEFAGLVGKNDPTTHGHKVPDLKEEDLKVLLDYLCGFTEKPWMKKEEWKTIKDCVVALVLEVSKVADGLRKTRNRMDEIRQSQEPVATDAWCCETLLLGQADPKWSSFCGQIIEAINQPYTAVSINSMIPKSAHERFRFFRDIRKSGMSHGGKRICLYTHVYKNYSESLHFMWSIEEDHDLDQHRNVQRYCETQVPKYHSRLLKRRFADVADQLNIQSCKARLLYQIATDDASAARTVDEDAIDKRLEEFVNMKDDSIVYDLRALNKSKVIYATFFDKAAEVINEEIEVAVDDRRHDKVVHLAKAMSVRDLYRQVKSKLSDDTPCPSVEWFRLQFYPRHSHYKTAQRYTSKLEVKHMVQQRQLRSSHPDEHYCNAVFKYVKEFCRLYREHTSLFSMDDKCKVSLGEPGTPIAAVGRGKQVIVGLNEKFLVADHDFSRASLIPSVTLHITIPEDEGGSWYNGTPYVCLKDAVFQPSNPRRHAIELQKVIAQHQLESPILVMYTDGGPDHRCDYISVIYSMVFLFLDLDLDMLVLARNAPGHSWRNPAERIMSVLNLGLQSVGMMRQAASDDEMEKKIKRCNTMKSLREEAAKDSQLKEQWTDCIQDPLALVTTVFGRLSWKENELKVVSAAADHELERVISVLRANLDDSLTVEDKKAGLRNRPQMSAFLDSHVIQTKYCLSIKKCNGPCEWCAERRLPEEFPDLHHIPVPVISAGGEHYKKFEEVYGQVQPDLVPDVPSLRPINRRIRDVDPQIKATAQNAKTVKRFVTCVECSKPRVIYSNHKLRAEQLVRLDQALEGIEYVCGTNIRDITDDTDHIFYKISMRLGECAFNVETAYNSAGCFPDLIE